MADISKIKLPSGTEYNIKDAVARAAIGGTIRIKGTTTTALTDEATTNPITIDGNSYTAVENDAVFYSKKEFVFDGTKWHEFGDMSGLGALAAKDSASGTYTPAGSVSKPTFTGSSMTSTGNFTPAGTIAVNASSGSGTAYTPEGSIAVNESSGSGTAYTPEGSVSAPTISVATAGSTDTVKSVKTVSPSVAAIQAVAPTAANPSNNIVYYSVSEETLTLYKLGYTTGNAVTTENKTVKTGDAAYSASAPEFTGTQKKIAFTGTQKKLAFTGTQGNVSVSGTPEGTVSKPTFTGTEATITVS